MLLRMIYDDRLAQAAYLFGCQKSGEAIVIDPERDVDRYIEAARREGLRIVAAAETHIHADFLSGTRELAERVGARVHVSDEGGTDWKCGWLRSKTGGGEYPQRLLHHGDVFNVGGIAFRVLHTPGHTPEHICFVVTDRGGGASEAMGIVSGDFVFVGDVGRPDLLETAAGAGGAKEPAARALWKSIQKFTELPDYLQVWPAHGAGSACGKALGAVPQSTVGYEKRFNAAIRAAAEGEGAFVEFVLSGQPEPPAYFARMKRENRDGPAVLGGLPRPAPMNAGDLPKIDAKRAVVIDTRPWQAFKAGHLPGSLYIPLDNMFPTVAGSFIEPGLDIRLVVDAARVDEAVRGLVRIGLDRVVGFIEPSALESHRAAGGRLEASAEVGIAEAKAMLQRGGVFALDVRGSGEFEAGHIRGATNIAYPTLARHLENVPRGSKLLVNCRSGSRSSRACAFLARAGYDATNLAGGMLAWEQAGAETVRP